MAIRGHAAGESFDELAAWADGLLVDWDKQDRDNRRAGNAPFGLWPSGAIPEVERLRAAVRCLVNKGHGVRFGVMADNGLAAVKAMKSWTEALKLPVRGVATVGEDGKAADKAAVAAGPVYLKYTYMKPVLEANGEPAADPICFMKRHIGATRGVTVNPDFLDGELRMYGDLPLALFESKDGE